MICAPAATLADLPRLLDTSNGPNVFWAEGNSFSLVLKEGAPSIPAWQTYFYAETAEGTKQVYLVSTNGIGEVRWVVDQTARTASEGTSAMVYFDLLPF